MLITLNNPLDYIQNNALLVIRCIQMAIDHRQGDRPLIVGGGSMGGQTARYALAYMEKHGMPHESTLYFSYDSPHQGAYVPVADQVLARVLSSQAPAVRESLTLLDSVAARQLMPYYVHSWRENLLPLSPDPLREEYLKDLAAIGGYPSTPGLTRIAVANGRGDSEHSADLQPGVTWLHFRAHFGCAAEVRGTLRTLPPEDTPRAEAVAEDLCCPYVTWSTTYSAQHTHSYDGCPGGTAPFNRLVREALSTIAGMTLEGDPKYDLPCFIPTVSALDLIADGRPVSDPHKSPPGSPIRPEPPVRGQNTNFDALCWSPTNSDHGLVTPAIKEWLLRFV
jgi:hypothetical protein